MFQKPPTSYVWDDYPVLLLGGCFNLPRTLIDHLCLHHLFSYVLLKSSIVPLNTALLDKCLPNTHQPPNNIDDVLFQNPHYINYMVNLILSISQIYYPLVIQHCYWTWPIDIVDLPMNNMVIFHVPEGKPPFSYGYTTIIPVFCQRLPGRVSHPKKSSQQSCGPTSQILKSSRPGLGCSMNFCLVLGIPTIYNNG